MKKIEILAKIFNDVKGMKKYRGLWFRLNCKEVIIVRSHFLEHGLKATSVFNFCSKNEI